MPNRHPPEAPIESEIKTIVMVKKRHPRATALNNRLLALPIELRMQIYDELLAIPRTVYMFEPKVKSHLHNIMKFDKDLFTRRGCLRYKFCSPCVSYYDPRTTTFAARFADDEDCTHSRWNELVIAQCTEATKRHNEWIWACVHERLCWGPEIHVLELEFPKFCSAVTILKCLLLDRLQGWRELRKLSVLRIRIRRGNGGPLCQLDMLVLWALGLCLRQEMRRKVLLKRGPRIEIAW
jgi:hypothetical protein